MFYRSQLSDYQLFRKDAAPLNQEIKITENNHRNNSGVLENMSHALI
jgi:hypothetical protein